MKIHIFGASGSGVTTLGQRLADKLDLKYFDSDDYFWIKSEQPFTLKRNSIERNRLITEDLTDNKTESWILGGSVIHWGDHLFPDFDLIVFLYVPSEIRIERLKKREFDRFGDIIYKEEKRVKQFQDFIAWAADYDSDTGLANRTLKAHKDWLKQLNSPILEIIGEKSLDETLKLVLDRLTDEGIL